MSLQHYAILAAISFHKNHHIQNATTTTTPIPPPSTLSSNITVVPSSVVNFFNNNNINNNITSDSTITTYYGGDLGLFHQQNIRSNSYGSSDGKSANNKYPNSFNGNVNLLLGCAMLSLVTTILCVVCYCCHRNIKKRTEAAYRQQRQWQENDPNMEIYSVEQCYETSGLFLGESIDGLTTLSHEPPPSYDAVVAMQEQQQLLRQQQQQQLLLQQDELVQRNSPPPGYRSSLDVSTMVIATCSHTLPADGSMVICNSNENLTNSNNLFRQEREYSNTHKNLATANAIINMKKTLNAQSCCSLQRAEVENMWNAAAAAVAARAGQIQTIVVNAADSEPDVTAAAAVTSSKKTMLNYAHGVIGRHYLNLNDYRRGCPLCGKFRYDAEDGSSQDGGTSADDMMAAVNFTSENMDTYNGNQSVRIAMGNDNKPPDESPTFSDNECSCTNHKKNTHTAAATDECDSNGNDINNVALNGDSKSYAKDAQDDEIVLNRNFVDNNANTTISMAINATEDTETDCAAAETSVDDGAAVLTRTAAVNLDSINENGIIRLDMSKIIDKTGLPNYDAALKLESSGYV